MKKLHHLSLIFLLLSLNSWAQVGRNVAEYNLDAQLGLKGYDPVAVFAEGGGQAQVGNVNLSLEHEGVVYRFANQANRNLFSGDPEKYEPTYGGWCAYAMARGSKVDIDPEIVTINGRRAHYFVSSRAKRNFDRSIAEEEQEADQNWRQLSGEEPRN